EPCVSHRTRLHLHSSSDPRDLHSFPTRRSSDLTLMTGASRYSNARSETSAAISPPGPPVIVGSWSTITLPVFAAVDRIASSSSRSEEHTSELQSLAYLVCRLLLEKKKHA